MENEPKEREGVPAGIVRELGELGPGAVIFEDGLASLLNRHPASIKRAVERGELPRPARLLGKPAWTAGAIIKHLETRQENAAKEQANLDRKIKKLQP